MPIIGAFFPSRSTSLYAKEKQVELNDNEKTIFEILKAEKRMDLIQLKSQSGLSNKAWDKGIKGLGKHGITKVEKTDEGLFVEVL